MASDTGFGVPGRTFSVPCSLHTPCTPYIVESGQWTMLQFYIICSQLVQRKDHLSFIKTVPSKVQN